MSFSQHLASGKNCEPGEPANVIDSLSGALSGFASAICLQPCVFILNICDCCLTIIAAVDLVKTRVQQGSNDLRRKAFLRF